MLIDTKRKQARAKLVKIYQLRREVSALQDEADTLDLEAWTEVQKRGQGIQEISQAAVRPPASKPSALGHFFCVIPKGGRDGYQIQSREPYVTSQEKSLNIL